MKIVSLAVLFVPPPASGFAQTDSTSAELQALHARWFKAFDAGDGQAEWIRWRCRIFGARDAHRNGRPKNGPRAGTQQKQEPMPRSAPTLTSSSVASRTRRCSRARSRRRQIQT